jgi:hypothetical protein
MLWNLVAWHGGQGQEITIHSIVGCVWLPRTLLLRLKSVWGGDICTGTAIWWVLHNLMSFLSLFKNIDVNNTNFFIKYFFGKKIDLNLHYFRFHVSGRIIDYRCEDGRFPVSGSCVTISNPDSLSSSETGVNPEIRSWRKYLSGWAWCQKTIGGIYSTKKWRAETLLPGLEFNNFKPRLKMYLQKHLLAERFVFWGAMIGVFWKSKSRPI